MEVFYVFALTFNEDVEPWPVALLLAKGENQKEWIFDIEEQLKTGRMKYVQILSTWQNRNLPNFDEGSFLIRMTNGSSWQIYDSGLQMSIKPCETMQNYRLSPARSQEFYHEACKEIYQRGLFRITDFDHRRSQFTDCIGEESLYKEICEDAFAKGIGKGYDPRGENPQKTKVYEKE